MTSKLPPIVKLAERLLVDVENATTRFAKNHRHGVGAELRNDVMSAAMLAHQAFIDCKARVSHVRELRRVIDRLKIRMQLAQRVRAFASLGQFESLYEVTLDLGRQCGGWLRHLDPHPQGQNPAPRNVAPERAKTLSTRGAQREWARS